MQPDSAVRYTVLTPTYNSGPFLHRVWNSLIVQTCRDFEWLVIDDGSEDDTGELVRLWMEDPRTFFPVRLISKPNGGKHSAVNLGLGVASGRFTVVLDSDDELKPWALERMAQIWDEQSPEVQRTSIGVCGLCEDQHGQLIGDRYPSSPFICDSISMRYRHRIAGEKVSCLRTGVLRRYPFETEVDKFVPEAHVWFDIATDYNEIYVNEVFRVYHVDQTDRESLMAESGKLRYQKGHLHFYRLCMDKFLPKIPVWKEKIRYAVLYDRTLFVLNLPLRQSLQALKLPLSRLLCVLVLPLSYVLALRARKRMA